MAASEKAKAIADATSPSTSPSAQTRTSASDTALTATALNEHVAADHAWIRQNLARRFRVSPSPPPPDTPPEAERIDEAVIRERLLKIHGGRLPGRAGRQASPDNLGNTASTPALLPIEFQVPSAAVSPSPPAKSLPPLTSSKPRASLVKPRPANLRQPTPPVETAPEQPAVVAETTPIIPPPTERGYVPTATKHALQQAPAEQSDMNPYVPPSASATTIRIPQGAFESEDRVPAPVRPEPVEGLAETGACGSTSSPRTANSPPLRLHPPPQQPAPVLSAATRPPAPTTKASVSTPRKPISASLSAPRPPRKNAVLTEPPAAQPDTLDLAPLPPPLTTAPITQTSAVKPRIVIRPTIAVASPADLGECVSELTERESIAQAPADQASKAAPRPASPTSRQWENYAPPLDLLQAPSGQQTPADLDALNQNGRLIEERLADFRVKVAVRDAFAGPVITRYEVEPAVGVRGAQVVNLMKDLARALSVTSIRVVETIPGKTYMGLELPNVQRQMIRLSEVLTSDLFQHHPSKLAMALGKDITGEPVVADLAKAPHLLVAGTTGSGKSVGVNAMIVSLLYRATPDEVRFVMIDPKMLELSVYNGIPHLLAPVVTDMKLAANALHWCVTEMERRYRLMSLLGVRNLAGFNQKIREAADAGRPIYDPDPLLLESPPPLSTLPFIVVVVDEFADLMMVAGKKIEELIARLAQKARAAGIHLILATQRPSVDVITGLIKANIPTRIAFQVSSKVDSRTILDQMGAESLLGQGDMLYLPPGTGYPQRVHGAFVTDDEVHALAEHLKQYGSPDYLDAVLGAPESSQTDAGNSNSAEESDPLYDQAVALVIESRRASISLVQRQLRIGYNRAARLVEQMEIAGIVSPMESNGSRTVLVPAQ